MVKISDFFKKEDDSEAKKEPQPKEEEKVAAKEDLPQKPPSKTPTLSIPKEEIKKEFPSMQESPATEALKTKELLREKLSVLDKGKTDTLYNECLKLIEDILKKAEQSRPIEVANLQEKINILSQQLSLGNYDLANLFNTFTEENYLYAHSVNVCILALLVGQGLGYEKTKLGELGLAAILHDIGMVKFMDISRKPARLNDDERSELQEHPSYGAEILSLSKNLSSAVSAVAEQHHECINGQGYPKGLKGAEINEYAKIVAAVDFYEALMHPRAHRERLNPYEALRVLVENKERFDYRVLKTLIKQMGVYPIGSYIQLSSGEIGVVVKTNIQTALRPTVRIAFDSQGKLLEETKTIDLAKSPTLHIKKPVSEKELKL